MKRRLPSVCVCNKFGPLHVLSVIAVVTMKISLSSEMFRCLA